MARFLGAVAIVVSATLVILIVSIMVGFAVGMAS